MHFPNDFGRFRYQSDLAPGVNNYQISASIILAPIFGMIEATGEEPAFPGLWLPRYALIRWESQGLDGFFKVICPDIAHPLWEEGPGSVFVVPNVFGFPARIVSCVGEQRDH